MSKFNRLENIRSRLYDLRLGLRGDISDRHLIMLVIDEMMDLVEEVQDDD